MTWEMERFRAENERQRENSARAAFAYAEYNSVGQGPFEFEKRADFGLTFVTEPIVAYGATIDLDALSDMLNVDPGITPPIPLISGMVTEWDQDDKGFWTGAWVAVRVHFPPTDLVDPALQIRCGHHFTFSAVAMKDIPLDQMD